VARIGDAISHGGVIITGSSNVMVNGLGVARLGDSVNCAIHGLRVISTASAITHANGLGVAREGDFVTCGAVIVTGSSNVQSG